MFKLVIAPKMISLKTFKEANAFLLENYTYFKFNTSLVQICKANRNLLNIILLAKGLW